MRPAPTPPLRLRALLVTALAVVPAVAMAPASAAPRPESPPVRASAAAPAIALALAQPSPDLPGLPKVSLELARVPVDSPTFRRARARYDKTAATLTGEQARRVGIDHSLADLDARVAHARADLAAARARSLGLRARLDDVEGAIANLAVSLYTSGGQTGRVDAALAAAQPSINDADRRDVLGSASLDVLLAERAAYRARLDQAASHARRATGEVRAIAEERQRLITDRLGATDAEVGAAPAVAAERVAYEHARTLATVTGLEFPLVALDAYYRAAASSAQDEPTCGIRWWAIAGIARVEGQHGTFGGAALDELGDATRRIIGIPLDGTNNTQLVADSDGGALDGDPVYDRAVGPMQFIPETWGRVAADGNGDGVITPFNLYDAALAAARYLCRAGGALDGDTGLRTAYLSYNHSEAYVDRVLSFARLYERSIDLAALRD